MYSLTKYVGGHSDLVAGGVVGSRAAVDPVKKLRGALGTQLDPNTAWMIMRSMETLSLRMHKSAENAALVANFLRQHPKIAAVNYLGFLGRGRSAAGGVSSGSARARVRPSVSPSRAEKRRHFACSMRCR